MESPRVSAMKVLEEVCADTLKSVLAQVKMNTFWVNKQITLHLTLLITGGNNTSKNDHNEMITFSSTNFQKNFPNSLVFGRILTIM